MQQRAPLCLAALITTLCAVAQDENVQLSQATRIRCANLGLNEAYIAAERRFGFDSSYVEFLEADADWVVTPVSARRFTGPLAFLFDAVGTGDGMVCTGVISGSYTAFMYKVNNDGTLGWTKGLTGMQHSQTRIAKLFTDGASWYGYTNADSFGGAGFYRVESETTGTNFTVREITTSDDLYFRFYEGVAAATSAEHILCGAGTISGSADMKALLGLVTGSGATWMKQYALTPAADNEEGVGLCRAGGVNYACVLNATETPTTTAGYVMRIDGTGAVLGCTKLTGPSGVFLAAITELADGGLLAAGSTNFGMGMLMKLSASGSLIWARECSICSYTTINAFHRNGTNELFGLGPNTIYAFDADGLACGFTETFSVTASTVTPVVNDITPVNNLTPAVTTGPLTMMDRTPANTSSVVCSGVGIDGPTATDVSITPHPVPSDGLVQLGGPGEVRATEEVRLRDTAGRMLFHGPYGTGIDLRDRPSGVYFGDLPGRGLRFRLVRQ